MGIKLVPRVVVSASGLGKTNANSQTQTLDNTQNKTQRSELHGTGLTKKLIEIQNRKLGLDEKQALDLASRAGAQKLAKEQLIAEAESNAEVLNLSNLNANFEYDEYQLAAIKGVRKHKHIVIIGPAGAGKTTIEKAVVEEIIDTVNVTKTVKENGEETESYNILFTAFTGRAVQIMKKNLPQKYHANCMTAHSALAYAPEDEEYQDSKTGEWKERMVFKPRYTAANKFRYQVIVFEETSMFPVKLFNEMMAASPEGVRCIFVGDINQLPPVMDRPILPFAMMQYPTFELKKIHRQALDNPIIAASQAILKGEMPKADPRGFFIKGISDGSITAGQNVLDYTKLLTKHKKFNGMTDAVIVCQNEGNLGQETLNADLMDFYNPPIEQGGVIINRRTPIKARMGTKLFAINDKVMLLQNDNDLGLTNGQIGVVTDITLNGAFRDAHTGFHTGTADIDFGNFDVENLQFDDNAVDEPIDEKTQKEKDKEDNQRQASHTMTVRFPSVMGEETEAKFSTVGQYAKVAHAYAFTCHKSQGGEYPVVIVAIHSANGRMLNREWLYTAVTRARNCVYLMANNAAIKAALKNQSIRGNTLEAKAKSFLAKIQGKEFTQPMLLPAEDL